VLGWAGHGVEEEMGCELAGPRVGEGRENGMGRGKEWSGLREGDWAAGLACFSMFISFFFLNPTQSI
jgi:hypothetical protein